MAKEIIPCMKICFLGSSFIRKLSEKSETVTALLWSIGISLKWTPGYWVMRKVKNTDSIKNGIIFIFFIPSPLFKIITIIITTIYRLVN